MRQEAEGADGLDDCLRRPAAEEVEHQREAAQVKGEADDDAEPGVLPVLPRAAVGLLISWNDVLSGPTTSFADV
mgnify:CR=1 FL=1